MGNKKKDMTRLNLYISREDNDLLGYLTNVLDLSKNQIARKAIREFILNNNLTEIVEKWKLQQKR